MPLRLDGAELERSKSVWATMGGAEVREQFPSWAKVGRHQVELASGEPLLEDGKKVYVGYGSDFDGVPVGDADYVQARLRHKLQAARCCG